MGTGAPELCELFFGPETATLDVQVRDPGGNLLRKTFDVLNPPASLRVFASRSGESWSRTGDVYTSPLADDFVPEIPFTVIRFHGLLPGEYRVTVPGHRVSSSPGVETYCEERVVVLSPGEHRSVEIETIVMSHLPEPVNANGCREG
jgi:hypothetical protein